MLLRKTVIVGALLAAFSLSAAGCGGPDTSITQERLQTVSEGMQAMVEETAAGRVDAGEDAFWEVHPFFHEVDPLLREKDWSLAVAMWENVIQIELQYAGERDPDMLIEEGRVSLQLLPQVADALGLEASE